MKRNMEKVQIFNTLDTAVWILELKLALPKTPMRNSSLLVPALILMSHAIKMMIV